ncbi:MAG: hypothetical protein E6J41_08375 [Chloroflexi bacterium]|nr:MAG: hypothetical protein E6J41_08375 [Chloroflexota bacterium]
MRFRIVAAILCAGAVVAFGVVPAYAESIGNGSVTTVGPKTTGATVSQGTAGFDGGGTQAASESKTNGQPSQPVGGGAVGSGDGSDLVVRQIPFNQVPIGGIDGGNGLIINNPGAMRQACPAGQTGFFVGSANNNAAFQVVCVPNQAPAPPQATTVSPLQLAEQASARQPWPNLLVSANPGVGLTGLASWFWCAGNAAMADASASSGPLTVTVHATMTDVTWRFGDGTALSGDLGRAFPTPSDIQHVYETDSAGLRQGYQLIASVRWRVSFSVNGGPFSDLGLKTRDYLTSYLVRQLQPQAVSVP